MVDGQSYISALAGGRIAMDIGSLKPHVVITDPDMAYLFTVKKLIESDPELKGYAVWTAATAVETISTMHIIDRPTVFLSEYRLPDMDGYLLLRENVGKKFRFPYSRCIVTSHRDNDLKDTVIAEDIGWEEKRKIELGYKKEESLKSIQSQYRSLIRRGEREIKRSVLFDPLTGCMTREHAVEFWEHDHARARREYTPIGCVYADVNDLKLVNDDDKYGHDVGDELIRSVAKALRLCVRGSFDYVVRWGGDEFVIILPNCDAVGCKAVITRLRADLSSISIPTASGPLYLRVALGTSVLQASYLGKDPDIALKRVLKNAERAMYRDKRAIKAAT